MTDQERKPYTAATLARAAEVTGSYIRRLCREGRIDCMKVGRIWFISHEEGRRFLEAREETLTEA
jgi:hypothetical protein